MLPLYLVGNVFYLVLCYKIEVELSSWYYFQKRKEATFIADGLDNNASADKIIEYLEDNQKKKNKIYSLYSQTVRQRRTTAGKYRDNKHFLLVGHPLNVFSDDWDGGLNSGYFETFSHKSMLPKMISVIKNIDKKDPVTEYMKKKMIWQDTLIDYKRIMRKFSLPFTTT